MARLFFVTVLFSSISWAQYTEQPARESSSDLRSQSVLFSVEDLYSKKVLWLERTANLDYFLRAKKKDGEEIKKLASREGAKLDREFASRFLKCQYELPVEPGECLVTLRLSLKGEFQDICKKDERKSQEIAAFIDELEKRF